MVNIFKDTKKTPLSDSKEEFNALKGSSNALMNALIRRYIIIGERRFSNYWWASVIFVGACGFLFTGISSYLGQNLIPLFWENLSNSHGIDHAQSGNGIAMPINQAIYKATFSLEYNEFPQTIPFFPQGLLMSFYGTLGFLLSIYWWFLIFWNVGGGFNEFNKKDGFIRVFRWGYPGKNRKIDLSYSLKDVEAIRVELKNQRTIYLQLKGKREIPLTGIGQPLTLKEIEKQASELANFLQVSLEGL